MKFVWFLHHNIFELTHEDEKKQQNNDKINELFSQLKWFYTHMYYHKNDNNENEYICESQQLYLYIYYLSL